MTTHRSEKDSMGAIEVPADKLWGAQTQRSLEHFRISTEKMPGELIYALALTKRAAAKVNQDLGLLTAEKAGAIVAAADEVLAGKHAQEFPLAIWQTGSGTQSNMNMNEVLANRASELLGGERGRCDKAFPRARSLPVPCRQAHRRKAAHRPGGPPGKAGPRRGERPRARVRAPV